MQRAFLTLRHGQTDWNVAGKLQGHTDIPLNQTGHNQANAAAVLLQGRGITRIVASDLQRTRETAAPIVDLLGVPFHTDARLREATYGIIEGLTVAEMDAQSHEKLFSNVLEPEEVFAMTLKDKRAFYVPIGGEDLATLDARVMASVTEWHTAYPDDMFLFVLHSGTLRALSRQLLGTSKRPGNAAPTLFTPAHGGWTIQELKAA